MGIEDIQISEELETNAPSIKYRGEEGPGSPQEEQMIMLIKKLMSQGMGQEEAMQMAQQMMAGAEQQQMAQQMPRQMAAFGGIMGLDGRRKYGLGSKLKSFVRKVIPNEIADIAVKAAPFVAPFNPIAAGLMSGIGGFDQHGSISRGLKSGLKNYAMGQVARGIGGGASNLQGATLKTMPGQTGFGSYFSSPVQTSGGIGGYLSDKAAASGQLTNDLGVQVGDNAGFTKTANEGVLKSLEGTTDYFPNLGGEVAKKQSTNIFGKTLTELPGQIKNILSKAGLGNNIMTGLLVGGLGAGALMGNMKPEEIEDLQRGEGLDVEGIRTEVLTAMKDPSGEALKEIRIKYPFLGTQRSKDVSGLAMGGRIGYMGGGMTMGDPRMMMPQSRMPMEKGGIMDLGGMELDYRAEGGFVPIGAKEKADDVPARLSVNEFVFTADAVRNAGGGDIDQGAEIMENMMKNLEAGGQISEESQGMQGARDMFQTSQRLGEVL